MMRACITAFCIALLLGGCTHRVTTSPTAAPATPRRTARPARVVARIVPSLVPARPSGAPATPVPKRRAAAAPLAFSSLLSPKPYAAVTRRAVAARALFAPLPFHVRPPFLISTPPPVPWLAPDAAPQIVSIDLPSSVDDGEVVTGDVIASSNVASVEVRVGGFGRSMDKTAPGHFTLSVVVPRLPFFLRRRTYRMTVIARNTRGDAVAQTLPITVR